jgi:hypothetical protein
MGYDWRLFVRSEFGCLLASSQWLPVHFIPLYLVIGRSSGTSQHAFENFKTLANVMNQHGYLRYHGRRWRAKRLLRASAIETPLVNNTQVLRPEVSQPDY